MRMGPRPAQQSGHHDILVRRRQHLTQRRAGQAPLQQQPVSGVDVAGGMQPDGPVPSHARSPAASSRSSPPGKPKATLSTRAAPERSLSCRRLLIDYAARAWAAAWSGGLDRVDSLYGAGLKPFGFDHLESRGLHER